MLRRLRSTSNRCRASGSGREAVGSSSTTTSRLPRQRAHDAEHRLARRRQRPTGGARIGRLHAHRGVDLRGPRPHPPPVDQAGPARKAGDQGHVLADAEVVHQAEILVHEGKRQIAQMRVHGSAPSSRISPGVRGDGRPARILISVDLPAPFSPTSAWISPAPTVRSDMVERQRRRRSVWSGRLISSTGGPVATSPGGRRGFSRGCGCLSRC